MKYARELTILVKVMSVPFHMAVWFVLSLVVGTFVPRELSLVVCGIVYTPFFLGTWRLQNTFMRLNERRTWTPERMERYNRLRRHITREKIRERKSLQKIF